MGNFIENNLPSFPVNYSAVKKQENAMSGTKDSNEQITEQKDLTILFHLDSQQAMPNEFSLKVLDDMRKMAENKHMNIIFQIGCTEQGNETVLARDDQELLGSVSVPQWKGVKRFVISSGGDIVTAEVLPEDTVMNSESAIRNFITWGMKNYNSKHYVAVIMEHGHGWKGFKTMKPSEIGEAIKEGVEEGNKITGDNDRIDLLYLQSCLMGSTEAIASMGDVSDVIITSENPIYAFSNRDFDSIFGQLEQQKTDRGVEFSPHKFAGSVVDLYKNLNKDNGEKLESFKKEKAFEKLFKLKFESMSWFKEVYRIFEQGDKETCDKLVELLNVSFSHGYPTLSAIDMKNMPYVADSLKDFVDSSKTYGLTNRQLFTAIENSVDYGNGNSHNYTEQLHDLGHIMKNIINTENIHIKIKECAVKILKALEKAVINEQHDQVKMSGSTGMSIWSPRTAIDIAMTEDLYRERSGDFIEKTGWYELMERAVKNLPADVQKELAGLDGIIKETNRLLDKLDTDESLSKEEKREIARKIVENKKIIYKSEDTMVLSKY